MATYQKKKTTQIIFERHGQDGYIENCDKDLCGFPSYRSIEDASNEVTRYRWQHVKEHFQDNKWMCTICQNEWTRTISMEYGQVCDTTRWVQCDTRVAHWKNITNSTTTSVLQLTKGHRHEVSMVSSDVTLFREVTDLSMHLGASVREFPWPRTASHRKHAANRTRAYHSRNTLQSPTRR